MSGRIFGAVVAMTFPALASGADAGGALDLGSDHAMLSLMTLSPDFAAASYRIADGASDVDVRINRFPWHVELDSGEHSRLALELTLAYERAEESIATLPVAGERIDSRWETYGASLGLIHERRLAGELHLLSALRLGLTETVNEAAYVGVATEGLRDLLDGSALNWTLRAGTVSFGLGSSYRWERRDMRGRLSTIVTHALAESFDESEEALEFSERINVLSSLAEASHPTGASLLGEPLTLVLLGGHHYSFGENRRTLGYTQSWQAGVGVERPLALGSRIRGSLRLSAQALWADGMDGWKLSIAFDPGRSG